MGSVAAFPYPRALRGVLGIALIGLWTLSVAACQQRSTNDQAAAAQRRPQQAGQPVSPYALAGHIVGARAAVVMDDSRAAERHIKAIAEDITRSARIADPSRPIAHEAARAVVRPLPGVRSTFWLDAANLVVMVGDARHRSMDMIDQVCLALESLGDTLAIVVNVQDVTAKTADGATTLSRNCQLPEGQRAFMQAKRQVDVVAPGVREQFKRQQAEK